ncbi:hypothetical protein [Salidesulfovibrio brasiliensis]|nr:hypothetical protein [Salidesulfovibrio brasiliensis]
MGLLTKVLIILAAILFLTGQFTRNKDKRIRQRQKITNCCLAPSWSSCS